MGEYGWAFLSGAVTGQGSKEGSLQYISGSTKVLSGSSTLTFDFATNKLFLTGTMIISGTIQAHAYDVIQTNKIEINLSGSTVFGNDADDTHVLSGSLVMSGAIKQHYAKVTTAAYTIKTYSSIVGISSSAYVSVTLPSASIAGAGRVLIIKDEWGSTRTKVGNTHIALTASSGSTSINKIDHQNTYSIEGDSVALSLYSDGVSKWFIY